MRPVGVTGSLESTAEDEEGPALLLPVRIHSGLKCKLSVDGAAVVGNVEDEDAISWIRLISELQMGAECKFGQVFAQ